MATKKDWTEDYHDSALPKISESDWDAPPESFDITCVIGTVTIGGPAGSPSPYAAAFGLIADNGGEGDFSFPLGGRIIHVNVHSTEQPKPTPARR